jgi:oxygen-independent coproporphyrinogen-3 oxidase
MWPYYPDLLATPVPRYTSYPSAAEFGPGVGAPDFEEALATASGDVSLYVHIPFCQDICWYCGCNTGRTNRPARLASYIDALHREIALVGERLPASARVNRIAFGGGSPNAIAPTDFVRLMLSLTQAFHLDDPIISIELDPRAMDENWADALAGVGVHRASLGVQTFSPKVQRAIGRVQPASLIENCTSMLRRAGVSSLNFDLMYGLPGQSTADLEDTLRHAVALGADRLAVFGYAHVPHLIPRQKRIDPTDLPDQETRFTMAALAHQLLVDAGYVPVGFDHFALPEDPLAKATIAGKLHRNFQGFTDDEAPVLIGLGASAISSFPQLLVQNEKNAGRYRMMLSAGELTGTRGLRRSEADRRHAQIIEQLLCTGRASPLQTTLSPLFERLKPFISRGLIHCTGEGELVLSNSGLPYARAIAVIFDPYRAGAEIKVSSAV